MKDLLPDYKRRIQRKQLRDNLVMASIFILALAAVADMYAKL